MEIDKNRYKLNEDFIFKDRQIHLTASGKRRIYRPKKLTGSRIGSVFGSDKYRSQFKLWCEILGFFPEDRDERSVYFLKAGNVIEKILREYAEKKMNKTFKTYEPSSVSYDLFKDQEIFGGIPDGEEYSEDGKLLSILEIKTAQMDKYSWIFEGNEFKLEWINKQPVVKEKGGGMFKWFKNGQVIIPISYEDQLSLYLYLRGITTGYFCIAFIKDSDYKNPENIKFISEFNNYVDYDSETVNKSLSQDEHILIWHEFTLDRDRFEKKIFQAKEWYENHIKKGISPEMTSEDLEWFRF